MTWFVLKIIAVVSMTLDHAEKTFITQSFLTERFGMSMPGSYQLLHAMSSIGRMAFPIYAFGIAQGCSFTKNRKKFLLRLLLFAVLSEVPFQLAFSGYLHFFRLPIRNVLFTLLMGALACFIFNFFRQKHKAWIAFFPILAMMLLAEICGSDYGGIGILCVFLPYLFKDKKWKLASLAAMCLVLYVVQPYILNQSPVTVYGVMRVVMSLAGVALLALYNGEQGPKTKFSQLFFYAYYPLHLALFWGLSLWLGPVLIFTS